MIRSVLEHSNTFFVQVALILFFSVFISVLIREALRPRREVHDLSHMPLQEDDPKGGNP